MAKPNHGSSVAAAAKAAQAERDEDGPQGIGPQVSEVARNKAQHEPENDFTDGVITVVKDEGGTQTFDSFAEALVYSNDVDTLQVGKGTYTETFALDERVTIVGEQGAILDGSKVANGSLATIDLLDGSSGSTISGLEIIAVEGQFGSALTSNVNNDVNNVKLTNNTFNAGVNTSGSLVYLNPGSDGFVIDGNTFQGAALTGSPLLGIEGDDIIVTNNDFGDVAGTYPKVEVFEGANGTTDDVKLVGNTGIDNLSAGANGAEFYS